MTDSKYIHLLSMSIFDWQELTGLMKSICLDNVSFGYLILRVIVWSRLLHFFQPKKKKKEREKEMGERSVRKVWAPRLLFWLLPFSRSTWCVTKCPRAMFLLGHHCLMVSAFWKACLRGTPRRVPPEQSGTASSRLEKTKPGHLLEKRSPCVF